MVSGRFTRDLKICTQLTIYRGYSNLCHEYDFYFIERSENNIYFMSGENEDSVLKSPALTSSPKGVDATVSIGHSLCFECERSGNETLV